jgi:hypothetical protein
VVASIALTGQTSFTAFNQSSQLTAIARFSDGTTKDVTTDPESTWNSEDETVAKVVAGKVTAQAYGTTSVYMWYRTENASLDVRVLPAGNFVLSGTITEPGDLMIDEAVVEVTGGGGIAPRRAISGDGRYAFNGLSGAVTVTVSRDGYVTQSKSVTMSEDRIVDFELAPTSAPANIAGTYSLTFTASSACGSLPPEVSKRTYIAKIEQSGASVSVQLSGAEFIPLRDRRRTILSDRFDGRIKGRTVSFHLAGYDYYGNFYDVAEHVGGNDYLAISGDADGTVTGKTISGTLKGAFSFFTLWPGQGEPVVACTADDHQFSLF